MRCRAHREIEITSAAMWTAKPAVGLCFCADCQVLRLQSLQGVGIGALGTLEGRSHVEAVVSPAVANLDAFATVEKRRPFSSLGAFSMGMSYSLPCAV